MASSSSKLTMKKCNVNYVVHWNEYRADFFLNSQKWPSARKKEKKTLSARVGGLRTFTEAYKETALKSTASGAKSTFFVCVLFFCRLLI